MKKSKEELVEWYIKERPSYVNLANKVESIIKEVLDSEGAKYYSISSRAKEIDSFISKASKEKYNDPQKQLQDLAGIRIITYVKSEVNLCCELIKPLFNLDDKNSSDKGKELGHDKVGYRSVHYVATLNEERFILPEYKLFEGLYFEIQIRTILEHAWADIAHDRSYKFKGEFPPEYDIERRFALASATLELVDREFDSIAKTLDEYEIEEERKTESGELDSPINSTSLKKYLSNKLSVLIKDENIEPTFNKLENQIIEELSDYGIDVIEDLDKLIDKSPSDFFIDSRNFMGYLRELMMLNDADKYFKFAWNNNWISDSKDHWIKFSDKGIDIEKYLNEYEEDNYEEDY